jgi:pyruvate/2-oxoglutarate dehydrogenase complex dihydrolipoamide acyltransferase (E2) component
MSVRVIMPQLGESVAEGTVIEWLKREGDRVRKDEPLLAVSTEKVDAEIPAPAAGMLSRILAKAGDVVPIGATLALIAESFASGTGIDLGPEAPTDVSSAPPPSLGPRSQAADGGGRAVRRTERFYSPAVRKLAEESRIDLAEVAGTGEGGRVTRRDVELFLQGRLLAAGTPGLPPAAVTAPVAASGEIPEELIPLTRMRRSIAAHMVRSKQTAPHVTSIAEADFTAIAEFRAAKREAFRAARGVSLTFLPFLVKATAEVLRAFPMLNARWTDEGIRVRKVINLGIAVALPEGLVVPVLRNPGARTVSEIAVAAADLARRASEGRLIPQELSGGTFTVNNFGADGNLIGTPLLNQPEVGNLGIGTIEKRPVVRTQHGEDAIVIRWMGYLCLSYDHRIVDGAVAGGFLQTLGRTLEAFAPGRESWADPFLDSL